MIILVHIQIHLCVRIHTYFICCVRIHTYFICFNWHTLTELALISLDMRSQKWRSFGHTRTEVALIWTCTHRCDDHLDIHTHTHRSGAHLDMCELWTFGAFTQKWRELWTCAHGRRYAHTEGDMRTHTHRGGAHLDMRSQKWRSFGHECTHTEGARGICRGLRTDAHGVFAGYGTYHLGTCRSGCRAYLGPEPKLILTWSWLTLDTGDTLALVVLLTRHWWHLEFDG